MASGHALRTDFGLKLVVFGFHLSILGMWQSALTPLVYVGILVGALELLHPIRSS